MRTESDFIGEIQIPENALYGIHSKRAVTNFPDTTPFHLEWYKAIGIIKLASSITFSQDVQPICLVDNVSRKIFFVLFTPLIFTSAHTSALFFIPHNSY